MTKIRAKAWLICLLLIVILSALWTDAWAAKFKDVPVKGMVTMIDLGATSCIPCKMMAPILKKLKKAYKGNAAIIFIDVWKHRGQSKRFGIRVIPTQLFFDKKGVRLTV